MKYNILGVTIDSIPVNDIRLTIKRWLNEHGQHQIATVNPEFIVAAHRNQSFRDMLNAVDLRLCDGVGLVWATKLLHQAKMHRLTGVDLVQYICDQGKNIGAKVFLIGGADGVGEELFVKYKNNPIVGALAGGRYDVAQNAFVDQEQIIGDINASGANILLVALGQVKQESWIAAHLAKMPGIKIAIGVGGTFDYLSGRVRRAPRILRLLGLEWLFRLIVQPWRAPRIFDATIYFAWLVVKQRFKK